MLKRVLLLLVLALAALPLAAQAPADNPLANAFRASLRNVQMNLEESADLMPEEHYGFRPTPEIRPFGEWVSHTAMANYSFCSAIKGEPRPSVEHLHNAKAKADISKALKESFQYCAEIVKGLDDQQAPASATAGGAPRVRPMFSLIGTLNSHYGNIVIYLRLKGLVPPSTARSQKQQQSQKK